MARASSVATPDSFTRFAIHYIDQVPLAIGLLTPDFGYCFAVESSEAFSVLNHIVGFVVLISDDCTARLEQVSEALAFGPWRIWHAWQI